MEQQTRKTLSHQSVVLLILTALFAALTGICSQLAIPMPGLVPISLASFACYLAAVILPWKQAFASQLVYILLGAVGVPVFSGFGTLSRLIGPTGGYIVGYALCALTAGLILSFAGRKFWISCLALAAGTALLYLVGTVWYMLQSGSALVPALLACVVPFLIGDVIKIAAASFLGGQIRRRLAQK